MAEEVTVATRLVLICNPNNPTSTAVGLEQVEEFLRRIPPHVAVVLDEAYCEYSLTLGDPYASVELLARHPNLVLLRTFSKVYGLAGLRVGYALCGTDTFRTAVDQVRQPFFLGLAAQAAAVAALGHQDEVERRVVATVAARSTLITETQRLGLWVADSDANFVWIRLARPTRTARGTARTWSCAGCASAAYWSGRGPRSGAPAACGSRSVPRRRTSGSWKGWDSCSLSVDGEGQSYRAGSGETSGSGRERTTSRRGRCARGVARGGRWGVRRLISRS